MNPNPWTRSVRFFKYWARDYARVETDSGHKQLTFFGHSNVSLDDARREAAAAAHAASRSAQSRDRASGPRESQPPDAYGYLDRPFREEVIEEFTHADRIVAVLTRNAYGSIVLNAAEFFFADVDDPEPPPVRSLTDVWRRLFRRNQPVADAPVVAKLTALTRRRPEMGVRLYRTAGGFRCLVTHRPYDPLAGETRELLEELGSDPLYTKLCETQACFRARLSPKFWRCRAPRPPTRFPFANVEDERRYRSWEEVYERRASHYSTCSFVGSFGESSVHPALEFVLSIHDRLTCVQDRPLA